MSLLHVVGRGVRARSGRWSVAPLLLALALPACSAHEPAPTSRAEPAPRAQSQALVTPSITESADDMRTGWYPNQAKLSPGIVGGGTFGQLFSAAVTGQVYAQPLVSQGTLFIATESNDIYGLDPEKGTEFWHRNLGKPFDPTTLQCADLVPNIGITGTPVIDSATNTAYFFAKVTENGATTYYAHGVNVATGAEAAGFPVAIKGQASNAPGVAFDAEHHLQRPGLLLQNGVIYAAFGGHCDAPPFRGWIVGVSTGGAIKTLWTANAAGDGAGIWQSGGGIMSDGAGRLFVATGNGGALSGSVAGSAAPSTASFGEAVVRVQVRGDGSLEAADFFSPYDAVDLDGWDADFASGGPAALPDSFGAGATPHLLVAVGKQGYVYLLNRDNLGGIGMGPGAGDAYVFRTAAHGGVWSKPAVWPGDGGYVYIPTASGGGANAGTTGFLYAYTAGVGVDGKPTLNVAAKSSDGFGFSSSRPVVTSDGTTNGSAILWTVWSPSGSGNGAQLRAYRAVPNAKQDFDLIYSAPVGQSSKFNPPGIGLGRVYVGTRDGKVLGFGSPVNPVLSAPALSFGPVIIGSSAEQDLKVTASQALTISNVASSTADFVAGAPAKLALGAGESTTIPITFKPAASGLKSAAITVNADAGSVSTSVTGKALSPTAELVVAPPAVSFGGTPIGVELPEQLVISNNGATELVLNSVTPPAAPFTIVQLPGAGTKIAPGDSLTLQLSFKPSALGMYTDKLTLASSAGNLDVPLSGVCAPPGKLEIAPVKLDYGRAALMSTRYGAFTLTNSGGVALTVTKSKPPAQGLFSAISSLPEGTSIAPGQSLVETVAFTPTAVAQSTDSWILNADDGGGVRQVDFTGIGMMSNTAALSDSGWQLNGSAMLADGGITLTAAEQAQAVGSAFWKTPLASAQLDVSFDLAIGNGEGADGMTFVLADPAKALPTALGAPGSGLGYAGIGGVAVAFDTYQGGTDPSDNFVGIAQSADADANLIWVATSTMIPKLSVTPVAPHHGRVQVVDGALVVSVDGAEVLRTPLVLPPQVLVGFTASNGGYTDLHAISNVSVVADAAPLFPAVNNGGAGQGGAAGMSGSSSSVSGAGGAASGAAGNAAAGAPITANPAANDNSCGCRAVGSGDAPGGAWLVLLALVLPLARRAKRRERGECHKLA